MSSIFRLALGVFLVLAAVALSQYTRLLVQIRDAQMNFKSLSPGVVTEGEKRIKERIADSLNIAGFDIEPKDISVKVTKTGTATLDLVTVREAKILFFTIRKEVVFHQEPIYSSAL